MYGLCEINREKIREGRLVAKSGLLSELVPFFCVSISEAV